MNLEDIYIPLFGASNSYGVKYDVIKKWFTACRIVDGSWVAPTVVAGRRNVVIITKKMFLRLVSESLFTRSYERVCPNREDLSQAQFIQFLGILTRDTKQKLEDFVARFNTVKQVLVDEVMESRMGQEYQ